MQHIITTITTALLHIITSTADVKKIIPGQLILEINNTKYHTRGEGEIEKVFVLDAHGFIRQKEVFVERSLLRSWSLETGF